MVNQQKSKKPKIEVMFSSQYPEEAKDDIIDIFEEEFEVKVSSMMSIRKDVSIWIAVTVVLVGVGQALKVFLKNFIGESGKLLAQKLFGAANRVSETERPVTVQLEIIINSERRAVTGKDAEDLYQKLLEMTKEETENQV